MKPTLLRSLLLGAAIVSASINVAAACKVPADGDTPPAWTTPQANEDPATVSAVGSATIDGDRLSEALAAARTQALKELAERIRVSVSSSVKLNDSKVSEGGKQVLRSSIESVAEATTSVTLQNVRADQQWVDARRCQAWVRVSVSRADFDRARKRDVLLALGKQVGAMLATAEDASKPLPQRESSAAAAASLLGTNDFSEVPEVSAAALKVRLGGVTKMLQKMKQDETRLLTLAQAHVEAYAAFKSSTNPVERLEAAGRALRPLRSLMAAAWVPDESTIGFVPQARLVSLLSDAGYPCLAKQASNEKLACAPADVAQERQKEYFAGRQVVLSCGMRLAGKPAPWVKACASLSESLAKLGARTEIDVPVPKQLLPGVTYIRLMADGRTNSRTDPEDKTAGYRFEGTVSSQVRGLDSPIDDSYQALTGWNPVSTAMATDILAISAAKRLVERIGQSWQ
ncbi:MAG: LPP20 family lipoprotein [Cytophagales bacterium]|nr:LPP20 family lipoprotein [Rhizobacter sp.]